MQVCTLAIMLHHRAATLMATGMWSTIMCHVLACCWLFQITLMQLFVCNGVQLLGWELYRYRHVLPEHGKSFSGHGLTHVQCWCTT